MSESNRKPAGRRQTQPPAARARVKMVAEMPQDDEMQKQLQQQKENDGFPGSCGV